jgi:penicillin-binding protein 1A
MTPTRHRLLRFGVIVAAGGIAIGLCAAALVPGFETIAAGSQYSGKVAPQLQALVEPSTIYDTNGAYFDTLGRIDRRPVTLSEVPQQLIDAVLATEDRTFYDNPGVDVQAIVRALVSNVESGDIGQGGSTITQQLIKNRYFKKPARDLNRKVREAALAVRLNEEWSKQRILQEYLNTVYFGQGSYGVKAAAARFFDGAELSKLDLAQSALLAGVIGDPEAYNPFLHPDAAARRRKVVLDRMVSAKYITQAEADVASVAPLPDPAHLPPAEMRADTYYADWIQQLITDPSNHQFDMLGRTATERENQLFSAGLRIYSAYDPRIQVLAQSAIDQVLPDQKPFTAAIAVMNPADGSVPAIASGLTFAENQCNLVTMPKSCSTSRQPGSTFKGITLTTAIANGYSPSDTINGSQDNGGYCTLKFKGRVVNKDWKTKNAEGGGGVMTLRNATRDSVNCAYFRLGASLGNGTPGGWNKVLDMANRLGVNRDFSSAGCRVPISVIGNACGVSPLDMATAYSTLDADGVRHDPVFIRRIVAANGKTIYQADTEGTRVLEPQVARTVTDVLTGVVNGTGTRARLPGNRVLAGKTGTTDNKVNAWFVGYTPQLVAAVWMGDPGGSTAMTRVGSIGAVYGGTYPAMIWQRFMATAMDGQPVLPFTPPDTRAWPAARYITEDGRGARTSSPSTTPSTRGGFFFPPPSTPTVPPSTTTTPTVTTPPATGPQGNGPGNGRGNGNGNGNGNGRGG